MANIVKKYVCKAKTLTIVVWIIAFFLFSCKGKDNNRTEEAAKKVYWDKQPIEAGKTTTIQVEMTLNEIGDFRKTVVVYSNASESPTRLTQTGTVIENLNL